MSQSVAFVHYYTLRLLRGIETLVVSLANELVKQDYDISILTARRTLTPLITPDKRVKLYEFLVPRYYEHFFIAPQYALNLMRHHYDYVVFFFADFGEARAWHLLPKSVHDKTKLVLYLCYPYSGVPHRYNSMNRAGFFQQASLVLADAQYVADDAAAFVNRPISVVPVGTDPVHFALNPEKRKKTRQQYGYTDEHIVLLNVSALEVVKGPRRVIQMLPELLKVVPNVRYLVLGKGHDEHTLHEMVSNLGLDAIVTFAGTTTDLPAYYSAADIFVMLPDNEANSIASHEALSCSLPAVVSKNGGFVGVMRPEFSIMVDSNNSQEVIQALTDLCNDPARRAWMGQQARHYIEQHLSWESSTAKFVNSLHLDADS